MTLALPPADGLRLGLTREGAALALQRGSLRVGVERTWQGQVRAGLTYRTQF